MTDQLTAPTAQHYWGVSGVLLFGILTALAFAGFACSIMRRFRPLLLAGRGDRVDRVLPRIRLTFKYAFLQFRMFQDPYAGVMHMLIFTGFIVLVARSAALIVEGFVPGFILFKGVLGHAYTLAKDVVEVLVLIGVALAVWRRAAARPKRLDPTFDSWFILFLIGLIVVTDLLAEASRIALDGSLREWWTPVAGTLASAIAGAPPSLLSKLFATCWWLHLIDILVFANYLPYSKHFHIITAIPNIFTQRLSPMGQLRGIDLESAEKFGASRVEDFGWKALLDGYACTECGRCRVVCPTALTGKPLDPKAFIGAFRDALYADTPRLLARAAVRPARKDGPRPPEEAAKPLIGGWISEDSIWACTTCGYCTAVCPVFIVPAVDKIVEMRRHLVLERAEFPKEMQTAFRGMETNGNPWGIGAAARADWARELPVVTMAEADQENIEFLFWVGCAGSYDDRGIKVSKTLVEILNLAGIKFAILGNEEQCTGDSARRMGNEYLFQTLARQNIETLNHYGVRKIVTNCPHCFNCLKNEYPQFGGNYEVVHGSELVAQLLSEGRLRLDQEIPGSVTFHDPCYLGRYNNVYDAPRRIIEAIPGLQLKEATHSREHGLCCGAGGGRMWMEEKLGQRINQTRMKEIVAAGADKIAVSCPFCMVMLSNANEEIAADRPAFDVLELARAAMAPNPDASAQPAQPVR